MKVKCSECKLVKRCHSDEFLVNHPNHETVCNAFQIKTSEKAKEVAAIIIGIAITKEISEETRMTLINTVLKETVGIQLLTGEKYES